MLGQTDVTAVPLESNLLSMSSHEEHGQHGTPSLPSHQMVQQGSSESKSVFCAVVFILLNINFY